MRHKLFLLKILILGVVFHCTTSDFSLNCNYVGVSTPQHALPFFKDVNRDNFENFVEFYRTGKEKCLKILKKPSNSGSLNGIQQKFLSDFGILFLEFGPISECPIFSQCWFGILTCGELKTDSFSRLYKAAASSVLKVDTDLESSSQLPLRQVPTFLEWSLQSLQFQFRIVGPEVLFPEVVYLPSDNLILCRYTLTIPGSYNIEVIPREFFPGTLFDYSETERLEGFDLIHSSLLQSAGPLTLNIHPMKSSVVHCNQKDKKPKKTNAKALTVPSPLPLCSSGNHEGRYITLPSESLTICGADKFLERIYSARKTTGDSKVFAAIGRSYLTSDLSKEDKLLRKFLTETYLNTSLSSIERYHLEEILRHTDEESSLCPLIVINDWNLDSSRSKHTRHEIFAPYTCRYKFYSPSQARGCLQNLHRTKTFSIGDSMSRELYGFMNIYLNNTQLSLPELKALCSTRSQVESSDCGIHSIMKQEFFPFTRYSRLPLKDINPSIFTIGFSWAHLTDLNITDFRQRVSHSKIMANIRQDVLPLTETIKIFQTSTYATKVSLEPVRRRNTVLRDLFVNQLHFHELDEYQLTATKFEAFDGLHYKGVSRYMSVMISLNLMCRSH